jgi:hypothetical protein
MSVFQQAMVNDEVQPRSTLLLVLLSVVEPPPPPTVPSRQ